VYIVPSKSLVADSIMFADIVIYLLTFVGICKQNEGRMWSSNNFLQTFLNICKILRDKILRENEKITLKLTLLIYVHTNY